MCEGYRSWLPELIAFDEDADEIESLVSRAYCQFEECYLNRELMFAGWRVVHKRLPFREGRNATFYHLVTWGSEDHEDRSISSERCRRITWPRAIIEHYQDESIWVWEKEIKGTIRIHMYLVAERYVVVLEPRVSGDRTVMYLWTAYIVDSEHYHRKLEKSYMAFKMADAAFLSAAP